MDTSPGISWIIDGELEFKKFIPNYLGQSVKFPYPLTEKGHNFLFIADLFLTFFDEYMFKLKREFAEPLVTVNSISSLERCDIKYVRFANKFIVGVSGSYKNTVIIKNLIRDFLEKEQLLLTLIDEKLQITSLASSKSNYVEFLGYYIRISFQQTGISPNFNITNLQVREQIRDAALIPPEINGTHSEGKYMRTRFVEILISKKVIKEWLIYKGLANAEGKGRYVGKWIYLSDVEIILRYNSVIKYLIEYYNLDLNNSKLHEAVYIIKYSFLHTLAAKHRMSLNQVSKKYILGCKSSTNLFILNK